MPVPAVKKVEISVAEEQSSGSLTHEEPIFPNPVKPSAGSKKRQKRHRKRGEMSMDGKCLFVEAVEG
jgi:hypothetical protein